MKGDVDRSRVMFRQLLFLSLVNLTVFYSSADAQSVNLYDRGKYLMEGPVACGNCHVQRGAKGEPLLDKGLSGGMVFDEPAFKAVASNITPDKETGIGNWTDQQLEKAIREGIRPNGTVIGPPMPIEFYRKMSDEDLKAIIIYMRAQPAVRNQVPKSIYNIPLPVNYGPTITQKISTPSQKNTKEYGEYLTTISHCMDCHNPRNEKGQLVWSKLGSGGQQFKGPWGISVSRNLTPHEYGLKNWTNQEIATAIQHGIDRSGQNYRPPMAFSWYKNINKNDLDAIIQYLRSLKPLSGGN